MCAVFNISVFKEYEMRNLMKTFKKSESGASLVEYAVALIVVTIVGGAGVIALGGNAGVMAEAGYDKARTAAVAAAAASAKTAGTGITATC